MTKIQKIIYGIIAVAVIWIILFLSSCTNNATAWRIWDLAEQINSLQDKKQDCYDNLNLQDTAVYLKWEWTFCFEWDDEIQSLRAELDELTDHSYKKIKVGLSLE